MNVCEGGDEAWLNIPVAIVVINKQIFPDDSTPLAFLYGSIETHARWLT
jgi:hypothetical protein